MTQIKKVKTLEGVQFYPQTHTKAVIDDNGYTAESRLQAMQDEINQAQLEAGAVPSDLTPTSGSSNWVTSGGVYNALKKLSLLTEDIIWVAEDGIFFIDDNNNIGVYIDQMGIHAINLIESERVVSNG